MTGLRRLAAGGMRRWLLLAVLSVLLAGLFEAIHLPAALLLGPLAAAAAMAAYDALSHVPPPIFRLSQAVIGTLVAQTLPFGILAELARDWPTFLLGALSVSAASSVLDWMLARW
jgi:uncharacterized membrane protein AbrB (regulator of aidB expression)